MCDKAKIIPQNLHAIQNRKENCLFSPDGVTVPSSKMIFFSKVFVGSFSVGVYKRAEIPMSSIEWLGRLK